MSDLKLSQPLPPLGRPARQPLAAAVARAGAAQAPVSAAIDQSVFGPEVRNAMLKNQIELKLPLLLTVDIDGLQALSVEADQLLGTPGLNHETEGLAHMLKSGATGQLALKKVERKENGKVAWLELNKAVALAPGRIEIAQAFGRAVLGVSKLNMAKRFIVTHYLGMDTKGTEGRRAIALQAAFPDDCTMQLVRQRLADHVGDRTLKAEADAAVERLKVKDPAGLKIAELKLSGDANKAKIAEADIK